MIFHRTESHTYDEPTLMQLYEKKKNANKDASSVENNEQQVQYFPDITNWEIEELERMYCKVISKLASKWSVNNTFKFYRNIDKMVGDRLIRGGKVFTSRKIPEGMELKGIEEEGYVCDLELGLGLNKLVEIANDVYGVNNWMSEIGDSEIVKYNEEKMIAEIVRDEESGEEKIVNNLRATLCMSTKVSLILADNTMVTQRGFGYADNMNREMAFKKCKKESVTDGMKRCFAHLVILMLDYEDKVREGYYPKYK